MHTDKVCFVTQDIKERYENIYDMFRRKFHVIHNGYDREDYKVAHEGPSDFTFSMVYTGNMGLGREKFIPLFAEVIQKKNDEYINRNLKIVLYSNLKRDSFRHESLGLQEVIHQRMRTGPLRCFGPVAGSDLMPYAPDAG